MRITLAALLAGLPTVVSLSALAQPLVAAGPTLAVVADGNVVVRFSGMPGDASDWIGIAPAGSPATEYATYQYTGGRREGTLTFEGVGAGRWVARAFFAQETYRIRGESAPFGLLDRCAGTDPTLRVTTDGATVFVRFTGLCGSATDWIAVAPVDGPAQTYQAWRYTGGARDGVFEFVGLPPGRYEARVFLDWSGTHSYAIRAHSAPFWVAPAGCVCADASDQRSVTPARR